MKSAGKLMLSESQGVERDKLKETIRKNTDNENWKGS